MALRETMLRILAEYPKAKATALEAHPLAQFIRGEAPLSVSEALGEFAEGPNCPWKLWPGKLGGHAVARSIRSGDHHKCDSRLLRRLLISRRNVGCSPVAQSRHDSGARGVQ